MKIWRMPIACWIPNAANANSEYVILIVLFFATVVAKNAPQCYNTHACVP